MENEVLPFRAHFRNPVFNALPPIITLITKKLQTYFERFKTKISLFYLLPLTTNY